MNVPEPPAAGSARFSIWNLARVSFEMFQRHLPLLLGVALIVEAPSFIFKIAGLDNNELLSVQGFVQECIKNIFFSAFYALNGIPLAAVWADLTGSPVAARDAIRHGLSRFWPLFVISIAVQLSGLIGFFALIAPAVLVFALCFVINAACIAEESGPVRSYKRSLILTKGFRWKLSIAVIVQFALAAINVFTIEKIPHLGVVLGFLSGIVISAFNNAVEATAYYQLRVIKEKFGGFPAKQSGWPFSIKSGARATSKQTGSKDVGGGIALLFAARALFNLLKSHPPATWWPAFEQWTTEHMGALIICVAGAAGLVVVIRKLVRR